MCSGLVGDTRERWLQEVLFLREQTSEKVNERPLHQPERKSFWWWLTLIKRKMWWWIASSFGYFYAFFVLTIVASMTLFFELTTMSKHAAAAMFNAMQAAEKLASTINTVGAEIFQIQIQNTVCLITSNNNYLCRFSLMTKYFVMRECENIQRLFNVQVTQYSVSLVRALCACWVFILPF